MPSTNDQAVTVVLSEVNHSPLLDKVLMGMAKELILVRIYVLSSQIPDFISCNADLLGKTTLLPNYKYFRRLLALCSLSKRIEKTDRHAIFCSGRQATQIGIITGVIGGVKKRIHIRHHGDMHHHWTKATSLMLDIIINYFSTQIVAVSDNVKTLLCEREGVRENKVKLILNGVPKIGTRRQNTSHKLLYEILVISRTERWKNVSLLVNAYAHYIKLFPDSRLTIIGAPGDDERKLSLSISKLPEGSVQRISTYTNTAKWLKQCDLFIHVPSGMSREAFGLVYIEGLLSGSSCLFSRSGIIDSIPFVHNHVKIIDCVDTRSLLRAMIETRNKPLAAIPKDLTSRLESMFSMEKCVKSYVALFR